MILLRTIEQELTLFREQQGPNCIRFLTFQKLKSLFVESNKSEECVTGGAAEAVGGPHEAVASAVGDLEHQTVAPDAVKEGWLTCKVTAIEGKVK